MRFHVSPGRVSRGRRGGTGRTAHQVNPRADAHLFAALHHLERLVEQDLAGERVVDDFDDAVRQGQPPSLRIPLHAYPAAEGEFDDDAPAQGVGNVVVPKGEVALLVFEAHQEHLFHERELGLLGALRTLAHVARVKGDFVSSVGRVFVRGGRGRVVVDGRGRGSAGAPSGASSPGEARARFHLVGERYRLCGLVKCSDAQSACLEAASTSCGCESLKSEPGVEAEAKVEAVAEAVAVAEGVSDAKE